MAEITATLVKELREKTRAGMMDCKKALTETDGALEDAVDWLRKNGLAAAAKKAGRIAAEGLVAVATSGGRGAIVEVNAETDFVARNEEFQNFVDRVSAAALDNGGDIEALGAAPLDSGATVADGLTELVAKIGENMALRRVEHLAVDNGVVASYMHSAARPGLGRIGVIIALDSTGDADKLAELGHKLAMHIAAASPQWVSPDAVDPAALAREREILAEQARASGKSEDIVQKMVDGRVRKYYEEVALSEQTFVIDGETKVSKAIEAAAEDIGADIAVKGFVRFALGEGIEKKEEDFAAEVAATLQD
jgi:elongation factor Ts